MTAHMCSSGTGCSGTGTGSNRGGEETNGRKAVKPPRRRPYTWRSPRGAAELVFQVIFERNERGSLIVTTNLSLAEWTKIFADARME